MKLLNLLRRTLSVAGLVLSAILQLLAMLAQALFGEVHWQAPVWLATIGNALARLWRWLCNNPARALALAVTLAGLATGGHYGWHWYKNLPKPHTVNYTVQAPTLTNYREAPPTIDTLALRFYESVAPLENINKDVTAGISLQPAVAGKWHWDDDHTLRFTPAQDWPVAQDYVIRLDKKKLLAPGTLLQQYEQHFSTAAFSAGIESSEFYQDPTDSTLKKNGDHPALFASR